MKYRYLLPILLLIFSIMNCNAQTTPQKEVHQTINQMITLIEQQKYEQLIQQYANIPEEKLKELSINIKSSQMEKNMAFLLTALQQAKQHEPIMSKNNTEASFKLENFPKPLKFSKTNGKWALND